MKIQRRLQKTIQKYIGYDEQQENFWHTYHTYVASEKDDVCLCNIIGIGGSGKSRFCSKIALEARQLEIPVLCLALQENETKISILYRMRNILVSQYGFDMRGFDVAYLIYVLKNGLGIRDKEKSLIESSTIASALSFLMAGISSTALGTGIALAVDSLISKVKDCFQDKRYLQYFEDNYWMDDTEMLCVTLFKEDYNSNQKMCEKPFLIIFDGYDHVTNLYQNNKTEMDVWLKGSDGLICCMENVVWVIAGRERLRWAEENKDWIPSIKEIVLNGITEEEERQYLDIKLKEKEYQQIHRIVQGIPLYLFLVREMLMNSQGNFQKVLNNLPEKNETLILCYLEYLSNAQKQQMYIMSCFDMDFAEDEILKIEEQCFHKQEVLELERLLDKDLFSCIDDRYRMHDVIRDTLFEDTSNYIAEKAQHFFHMHTGDAAYYNYLRCAIHQLDSLEAIENLLNAEGFIGNVKPDKRYAFLRLNNSMRRKIRQYGSGTVASGLFYFTLGNVYKEMGLYEAAGREYKRSRNILQRTSIAEHIIDSVHEEEVQMQCLCGQNEDAYNWRLSCYEKYKNLYGEEHPFTVNVRQNVAVSLEYMGKLTDALQIYKEIYTCRKKNEDLRDNIDKTARAILSVLEKMGDQKALNQYARILLRDYKFFSMEQYLKVFGMIVSIPGLDVNFLIDVVTYIKNIKPQDLRDEQYFEYEQLMYRVAIILESGDIDLATELLEDTYQYRLQYYGENSLLTIGCEMELILCRAQKGEHQLALEQLEKLYVKVTEIYDLDDISLAKAIRSNIAIERAILAEEDVQNKKE